MYVSDNHLSVNRLFFGSSGAFPGAFCIQSLSTLPEAQVQPNVTLIVPLSQQESYKVILRNT